MTKTAIQRQRYGYKKAGEAIWDMHYRPKAIAEWPVECDYGGENEYQKLQRRDMVVGV